MPQGHSLKRAKASLSEIQRKEVSKTSLKHEQAMQLIQENENRFKELFNHMNSGVAIYKAKDNGRDFIIKDFNRAGEKIEKVKKEDIVGKSVLKAFPGVKDFGLFKVFQEVYKTQTSRREIEGFRRIFKDII